MRSFPRSEGMALTQDGKGLAGDLHRLADILIRERRVDEMVVMVGKEDASLDALGHPLLV